MKKQYCPVIVRRDGTEQYAKAFSSKAKNFSDRFCTTLEEAQSIIKEVTTRLNDPRPIAMVSGCIGITSEHCKEAEVIDSYIKVREVTEWKRL